MPVYKSSSWLNLERHASLMSKLHMRDLFASDDRRAAKYCIESSGIFLDYSKNLIRDDTVKLLVSLAKYANVEKARDDMFSGEKINFTEDKAVLHIALRNRSNKPIYLDGEDVMPQINSNLEKMKQFGESIRSGKLLGSTNKKITDVVHIGIGGSNLGPKMVCNALDAYQDSSVKIYFVSNVDEASILKVVKNLDYATTIFIVASKTFSTQETMLNAARAKQWFLDQGGKESDFKWHIVAVTANYNSPLLKDYKEDYIFKVCDWVGGRYSLWSAVGLVVIIAIGYNNFLDLLEGAYDMDQHFLETPLAENMPVILGMLSIWNNNFMGAETQAILPYDEHLRLLTPYLEQVEMESNGKSIDKEGNLVKQDTGFIVWGAQGIDGQHAFYQLLHQGVRKIPADFIITSKPDPKTGKHHDILMANFIAQTEALMRGQSKKEAQDHLLEQNNNTTIEDKFLSSHLEFCGNNTSNSILMDELSPKCLGALLSLYEHKVFVQGIVWNINSFDQWGVELGKNLFVQVLEDISNNSDATAHDCSTNALINRYNELKLKAEND